MRLPLLLTLTIGCASPEPHDSDVPDDVGLDDAVTLDALMGRLEALEAIADAHGGTRANLSTGYPASVAYAVEVLEGAGYAVELHAYDTSVYQLDGATLSEVGGGAFVLDDEGTDGFTVFDYSGGATVQTAVVPVDVVVPAGSQQNTSTSGCEAADFTDFPSGAIALVQRGSCTFADKVRHAEAAGAVAVVVFNEGQPGRTAPTVGLLDEDDPAAVPVVGISYARGAALVASGATLALSVQAGVIHVTEHNVIAEHPGRSTDTAVLVGAHLDSVPAGPGVNDNGSGTALVLEAAVQVAALDLPHEHTLRFALWGAEEVGLVGSRRWVYDTDGADDLVAVLNYDMLGSGNGWRMIYDGDGSDHDEAPSDGAAEIERIHAAWFDARGLGYGSTGMFVPTDSYWFVLEGIPTGGLYSGAYEPLPASAAAETGGVSGRSMDACYHEACDRVAGIDPQLYGELAGAASYAIQTLAQRVEPLPAGRRAARDTPRPSGCHAHPRWDR